jgi:hypothetical protein
VSGILKEDVVTTSMGGPPVSFQGSAQTGLVSMLGPPNAPLEPTYKSPWTAAHVTIGMLVGTLLFCCLPSALMPNPYDSELLLGMDGQHVAVITVSIPIVVLALLIPFVAKSIASQRMRRYRAAYGEWQESQRRWERAMQIWNELYYCPRDYLVFAWSNPSHTATPPEMNRLISLLQSERR